MSVYIIELIDEYSTWVCSHYFKSKESAHDYLISEGYLESDNHSVDVYYNEDDGVTASIIELFDFE